MCTAQSVETQEFDFSQVPFNPPVRATPECGCDTIFSFELPNPLRQNYPPWNTDIYNLSEVDSIAQKGCALTVLCNIIGCRDVRKLNRDLVECTRENPRNPCFDSNHNVHWDNSCEYLNAQCGMQKVGGEKKISVPGKNLAGLWSVLNGECDGKPCLKRIQEECWYPVIQMTRMVEEVDPKTGEKKLVPRYHFIILQEIATGGASSPGQFTYRVADPAGYHATLNDYLQDPKGWQIDSVRFIKKVGCSVRSCP
jgi:hypothetical protein